VALVVHGPGQLVDRAAVVPDAQQWFSYGLPGFKIDGKTTAGFAAFKNHLSYLSHSGSVFPVSTSLSRTSDGS
jgi:uncharacterized protein YdhG (YjbR/CyaY superfamily)